MISKILSGVAIIASCLFFISCQKDTAEVSIPSNVLNQSRTSGARADDPAMLAKVPVIASAEYLSRSNETPPLFDAKGKPDNVSPNVSFVNPLQASTVSGQVELNVSASDNVGVTLVSFYVDGVLIGTKSSAPFSFGWNSASVTNGNHTLSATAQDASGNTRTASITVTSNNVSGTDVSNPSVTITSPASGSSVSGSITIQANASDNVGVTLVTFKIDGNVIGTDNAAPYSLSFNTASVSTGSHTIQTDATDQAGNVGSHSVQVNVNTVVLQSSTLPSSYILVTPPVQNQGSEFSCVAFAAGYSARSIEQYYRMGASSYNNATNVFSPEYLYNQTKAFDYCSSGTGIVTVLEFMKASGVCTWQSMPYSDMNGCSLLPVGNQISEASNFKITSYSAISKSDITAIKTMLVNKHPIILTVNLDESFTNAQPGFIWQSYSGSGGFSHALTICGYDDSKNAFKVMNSWGTGWGDAGYSWINYSFLAQTGGQWTFAITI